MAPNLLGTSPLFLAEASSNPDNISLGKLATSKSIDALTLDTFPSVVSKLTKLGNVADDTVASGPLQKGQYKWDIVWRNVIGMIYLHGFSLYGLYLFLFAIQWKTFFWGLFLAFVAGQGITSGAHRLWAHRCYKARLPLRIFLAFCQSMAFQNHIYEWVRDHRVHHKFTDTDADPHNAQRGFFFSHVGWLLVRKHKDVYIKGKTVDMTDLESDGVVMFQRKYYLLIMPIVSFLIPCFVPWYYFGEDIWMSWYTVGVFRYTFSLNSTWLVNSAAHIYGNKPYDKTIGPSENKFVSYMALGEGWHNYHHVFPWDYKASELGYEINPSTRIIDLFAHMGWAYDLKTVSMEMIRKRVQRTGDGSWRGYHKDKKHSDDIDEGSVRSCGGLRDFEGNNNESSSADVVDLTGDSCQSQTTGGCFGGHAHAHGTLEENIWGWGDRDMSKEEIEDVKMFNQLTEVALSPIKLRN